MLQTSKNLLPRSTRSYSFWLSLSSCAALTSQSTSDGHCRCFMCLATLLRFSCLKLGCQNAKKNAENLFVSKLRKFRKFTVSSNSRFGDIKEVWYKVWQISPYKLGQVRACFCRVIEKSQIIQLNISFHNDNFRVDFIQRCTFCHI